VSLEKARIDLVPMRRRRREPHSRRCTLDGRGTLIEISSPVDLTVPQPHYQAGSAGDTSKEIPLSPRYVHVVDDDRDVRCSVSFMLNAVKLQSRPFGSGTDFLDSLDDLQPGCVLLDIRMPEIDGFQVMGALAERGIEWPVVVMTGHGEVSVAVRAMKLGAVDFIEKPFEEDVLLGSLERAFVLLKDRGEKAERRRLARERVALLSAREHDVLQGLMAGLPNKMLARRLDISLRTVEMHRANMMDRLQVGSLAEALTLAVQAGVEPLDPS
jgi:two-component system response regulator FixJ